jgi:hypothetical protein
VKMSVERDAKYMTHQQWHAEVKAALDLALRNKTEAGRRLQRLAAQCQRNAKGMIGDWQFEQSLSLAATTLEQAGRHKDAARLYRRLAKHHERSLTYQGQALASTQTAMALALFAAGERAAASRVGLEALRWAGQFQDPSAPLEKLLGEVRRFLDDKAQRGRRQSTGRRKARSRTNR